MTEPRPLICVGRAGGEAVRRRRRSGRGGAGMAPACTMGRLQLSWECPCSWLKHQELGAAPLRHARLHRSMRRQVAATSATVGLSACNTGPATSALNFDRFAFKLCSNRGLQAHGRRVEERLAAQSSRASIPRFHRAPRSDPRCTMPNAVASARCCASPPPPPAPAHRRHRAAAGCHVQCTRFSSGCKPVRAPWLTAGMSR